MKWALPLGASMFVFFLGVPQLRADGEPAAKPKVQTLELAVFLGSDASGKELVVQLSKTVQVCRPTSVTKKVKTDQGEEKEVQETVLITETKQVQQNLGYPIDTTKVFSGEGKEIKRSEWEPMLKKGGRVLYAQGDALDPSWKDLLKPESIILLVPVPTLAAPPPTIPMQKLNPTGVLPRPGVPRMPPLRPTTPNPS